MYSLKSSLQAFFHKHESTLLQLHPGLNLHTLIREFDWLYALNGFHLDLNAKLEELLKGTPLAYVIGYQYFYDGHFKVTPATLIPRPESELLVARALELFKSKKNIRFVDMATGSGAIGLSLARELYGCHAVLSDLSVAALDIAKINAYQHSYHYQKEQKLSFVLSDRLEKVDGKFDLIISNPPYIKRQTDRTLVSSQVLKFEPNMALFLDDEEYEAWFELFFTQAAARLVAGGSFLMEGHESHLDDLAQLMGALNLFEDIVVRPDLSGRARFLESVRNG